MIRAYVDELLKKKKGSAIMIDVQKKTHIFKSIYIAWCFEERILRGM